MTQMTFLPPTPMEMVEEYRLKANQEKNPLTSMCLIAEEFAEWEDSPDYENELKELADLVYVTYGYANSQGWNLDAALKRVHENNIGRMTQPDGTIKYREDGKVIKNKDYPQVDLGDLV